MTAFGKLIRTTAFRLTLVYLFLFALFAASLLGFFAWNTRHLITEQITATVDAETGEINDIFARRGLRGCVPRASSAAWHKRGTRECRPSRAGSLHPHRRTRRRPR